MAQTSTTDESPDTIEVDLRNPWVAGVLAWLIPGLGHIYQRRYAKGILFLVCILGTFFYGLGMAHGHVVYASLTREDFRWQYVCQLGVGASALPALVQNYWVRRGNEPLLQGFMAPPRNVVVAANSREEYEADELSKWHLRYHSYFELGTLYTMIAGLLNVLAVYDAVAGPVLYATSSGDRKNKPPGPPPSGT
ncbi:MAG: DUF6677 family protein [Pirellulaceae bacterium]